MSICSLDSLIIIIVNFVLFWRRGGGGGGMGMWVSSKCLTSVKCFFFSKTMIQ